MRQTRNWAIASPERQIPWHSFAKAEMSFLFSALMTELGKGGHVIYIKLIPCKGEQTTKGL